MGTNDMARLLRAKKARARRARNLALATGCALALVFSLGGGVHVASAQATGASSASAMGRINAPKWRTYNNAKKLAEVVEAARAFTVDPLGQLAAGTLATDGSLVEAIDLELSTDVEPMVLKDAKAHIAVVWPLQFASSPESIVSISSVADGLSTITIELDSDRKKNRMGALVSLAKPAADISGSPARGTTVVNYSVVASVGSVSGVKVFVPYEDAYPTFSCRAARAFVNAVAQQSEVQLSADVASAGMAAALSTSVTGYEASTCSSSYTTLHGSGSSFTLSDLDTNNLPGTATHDWRRTEANSPAYQTATGDANPLANAALSALAGTGIFGPLATLVVDAARAPAVVIRDATDAVGKRTAVTYFVDADNITLGAIDFATVTVVLDEGHHQVGYSIARGREVDGPGQLVTFVQQSGTAASETSTGYSLHSDVAGYSSSMSDECTTARTFEAILDNRTNADDSATGSTAPSDDAKLIDSAASASLSGLAHSECTKYPSTTKSKVKKKKGPKK